MDFERSIVIVKFLVIGVVGDVVISVVVVVEIFVVFVSGW